MTQRQLILLALDFSLYLNPKTPKKDIMRVINDVNGGKDNFKSDWINFTQKYNEITKSKRRDDILTKLGI